MYSFGYDCDFARNNNDSNTTFTIFDTQLVSEVVSIDATVVSSEFVDSNCLEVTVIDLVVASAYGVATFVVVIGVTSTFSVVVVKGFSVPVSPIRLWTVENLKLFK